jgi:hypothetical protein
VIVLGCAGMADLAARLSERHRLPVIDGVASAVKLGLKTSKIGAYALPRPKAYVGTCQLPVPNRLLSHPHSRRAPWKTKSQCLSR